MHGIGTIPSPHESALAEGYGHTPPGSPIMTSLPGRLTSRTGNTWAAPPLPYKGSGVHPGTPYTPYTSYPPQFVGLESFPGQLTPHESYASQQHASQAHGVVGIVGWSILRSMHAPTFCSVHVSKSTRDFGEVFIRTIVCGCSSLWTRLLPGFTIKCCTVCFQSFLIALHYIAQLA